MFFAALSLLSVPFVFLLIPETKGIPLESTDRLFEKGMPAWKAHRIVRKELWEQEQVFREVQVAGDEKTQALEDAEHRENA